MRPSAIRLCSSILATASALPSTRATTPRSSTSSLPAPSSFRAKAPRSKRSKSALTLHLVLPASWGDSPSSHDCSFRLNHRILPRTPTSPLLSCHQWKTVPFGAFRREHFRHDPDPHAFRRGSALLERSQHSGLGSHSCRFALHPRGRARQHAHLFSLVLLAGGLGLIARSLRAHPHS